MSDVIGVHVLGAGQDVGRSCVIVTLGGRKIMFDCGAHSGYNDNRRYPLFSSLQSKESPITNDSKSKSEKFTNFDIDCILLTHFHIDHCGALPYFTENLGYDGPILMSYPTKALSPILLKDSCKVQSLKHTKKNPILESDKSFMALLNENPASLDDDSLNFTEYDVEKSLSRAIPLQLHSDTRLGDLTIRPYYAGHVLGASIFSVKYKSQTVVYTGDFNTVSDKHLGPAKIPRLEPDVLICESTYATIVRQSRRSAEVELCKVVKETLDNGGKVLIPVFAVGRAQELAIILECFWKRSNLTYPIYFAGGMSERASTYYKLHSSWACDGQLFESKLISPFDHGFINDKRPMVLFATPGMLNGGLSLNVCKAWAPDPNNLILIPGYCVQGTVGNQLIMGEKSIKTVNGVIDIKCKIRYLSFSAHADSAGIQQFINHIRPKNIVLVHGERDGMQKFARHIKSEFGIPVFCPKTGQSLAITTESSDSNDRVWVDYQLYNTIVNDLAYQNPTLTRIVKSWSQSMDLSSNDTNEILARSQGLDTSSLNAVALTSNKLHCLFSEKTLLNTALLEYKKELLASKEPKISIKSIWQTSEIECDIKIWENALVKLSNNFQSHNFRGVLHIDKDCCWSDGFEARHDGKHAIIKWLQLQPMGSNISPHFQYLGEMLEKLLLEVKTTS